MGANDDELSTAPTGHDPYADIDASLTPVYRIASVNRERFPPAYPQRWRLNTARGMTALNALIITAFLGIYAATHNPPGYLLYAYIATSIGLTAGSAALLKAHQPTARIARRDRLTRLVTIATNLGFSVAGVAVGFIAPWFGVVVLALPWLTWRMLTAQGTGNPIRFKHGMLQSRVVTLTRKLDGRKITLIGMAHLASPDFYATVADKVTSLADAGAAVHVEFIAGERDGTPAELAVLAGLRIDPAERLVVPPGVADAGLLRQYSIRLPAEARRVDINNVDLLRFIGEARYRKASRTDGGLSNVTAGQLRFALRWLTGCEPVRSLHGLFQRGDDDAVREGIAVDEALRVAADRDVVLVWGAAHLPQLAAGFVSAKFAATECGWLDVANLKPTA